MPTSLTELFSPACHLCPRRCGAARDVGAIRLTSVEDEVLERHAHAYLASRKELL